jgi:RND family efflux transporter MFP subunit
MVPRLSGLACAAALSALLAACAADGAATNGATNGAGGGAAGGASGRSRGGGGGGGGGGSGGGGRGGPSVTLAATDIATVSRGSLEDGTNITGDLLPIETIQIRARVEGDLIGVLVREGEHVAAGQLLARFDSLDETSARASADARLAAAKNDLAQAEWTADQTLQLFNAGAVAEQELRAKQQAVTSARAQLAAADAQLRAAETIVADTRVVAPVAGTISARTAESGEHIARGSALFTMVRSDVLELTANLPARRASTVRAGQRVHFLADGRAFDGRVARVSPTVDPATRSVTVWIDVPNADGTLKGGTLATGRVINRKVDGALVIPVAGIRQTQGTNASYVWRVDGTVLAQANIQLGIVDDAAGLAEVTDGLREGDRIIVGNVGTLGNGMQVQLLGNENTSVGVAPASDSAGGARSGRGTRGTGRGGAGGTAAGSGAPPPDARRAR